jgi:hypothetical protein
MAEAIEKNDRIMVRCNKKIDNTVAEAFDLVMAGSLYVAGAGSTVACVVA